MFQEKAKIFAILAGLLVGGFLATSGYSYFVAKSSLTEVVVNASLPLTGDNIYSEFQQALYKPVLISQGMAQNTFVRDWVLMGEQDRTQIEEYLRSVQMATGSFTSFLISDATLEYYHPSGEQRLISADDPDDAWYFRVKNMFDTYEVNVDEDKMSDGVLTIFVNHRLLDADGRFLGVIGVGVSVDAAQEWLVRSAERYDRRLYFIDEQARVILTSPDYQGPQNLADAPGLANEISRILDLDRASLTYIRDGQETFLSTRLIDGVGWRLMVEQDVDATQGAIYETLIVNLIGALLLCIVVITLVLWVISRYQARLEDMATKDSLTGALNRHAFNAVFDQQLSAIKRNPDRQLSVAVFDIDHFKAVNDKHGHIQGDQVLATIADLVRLNVRDEDVFCRWGGEEFVVLFPDCALNAAAARVEMIRLGISGYEFVSGNNQFRVTVSAGVAMYDAHETKTDLLERADKLLMKAKRSGRNTVLSAA